MREIEVEDQLGNIFMTSMRYAKRNSLKKRLLRCKPVGNMNWEDALSLIKHDVEQLWKDGNEVDNDVENDREEGNGGMVNSARNVDAEDTNNGTGETRMGDSMNSLV